jgi:DNA-binding beta-propeller fold protein YncE
MPLESARCVLGTIRRVVVDPSSGRVLVLDGAPRSPVVEFTSAGICVGRRGAPRGLSVVDFAVTPSGDVAVVAGSTVSIIDGQGSVKTSRTLPFAPVNVA